MSYSVDYLPDKDMVLVKIKGRLNFKIAEQYSKEAVKLARQNDCRNFLIDHTETTIDEEIYKIHTAGEELQQFGFQNSDRIAIIVAKNSNYSKLLDTLKQNRMWSTFKYFNEDNIRDAYNWLLEVK